MAKIMLVDDAAFMRMMIKKALSSSGYNDFIEAQDGAEAVKKYSEEKPDMVIMDITMPNMDGLQALKKIREGNNELSFQALRQYHLHQFLISFIVD